MTASTLSRSRRLARALPAAALSVLLVAGCGQVASSSAEPARSQAAGTQAAGTQLAGTHAAAQPAADSAAAVTPASLAGRVAAALSGVHTGTAAVTLAAHGTVQASATVTGDATAPAAQATAVLDGQRYQMRVVGGSVYVSGPSVAALTRGRTWARVDPATLKGLARASAGSSASPAPSALPQPTQLAGVLDSAVSVRDLGAATVAGIAGHAFRVSLPVAALAELAAVPGLPMDAAQRARVRQGIDSLAAQGVTVLSADLTVDSRDRPLQLAASTPALAMGVPVMRVTATFSGWGTPVRVVAPAAADVATLDAAALTAASRTAARPTASSPS